MVKCAALALMVTDRTSVQRRALISLLLAMAAATATGSTTARARTARIAPLTTDGLPNVQAAAAVVMDAATGAEVYGKNSQEVTGIASTTKIFVAMVVRRKNIDLDGVTEITKADRDFARGGARTRLEVRHSFKNLDLLKAMLVASDNRSPTALGRAVGLDADGLVAAMNELARELGLAHTKFTDPTGLRGNVSTAREMAIAFKAALEDPLLAEIMGTQEVKVRSIHSRPLSIYYRNTNDALYSKRYQVTAGKTGFTDGAGYCLLIAAEIAGRKIIMVFLGEKEKLTRYGDFRRVADWLSSGKMPRLDSVPRIIGKSAIIRAVASGKGSL